MAEKHFVLIVGTSEYQDPDLKTLKSPAQDALRLSLPPSRLNMAVVVAPFGELRLMSSSLCALSTRLKRLCLNSHPILL